MSAISADTEESRTYNHRHEDAIQEYAEGVQESVHNARGVRRQPRIKLVRADLECYDDNLERMK